MVYCRLLAVRNRTSQLADLDIGMMNIRSESPIIFKIYRLSTLSERISYITRLKGQCRRSNPPCPVIVPSFLFLFKITQLNG
jgi:hypothetical protein